MDWNWISWTYYMNCVVSRSFMINKLHPRKNTEKGCFNHRLNNPKIAIIRIDWMRTRFCSYSEELMIYVGFLDFSRHNKQAYKIQIWFIVRFYMWWILTLFTTPNVDLIQSRSQNQNKWVSNKQRINIFTYCK